MELLQTEPATFILVQWRLLALNLKTDRRRNHDNQDVEVHRKTRRMFILIAIIKISIIKTPRLPKKKIHLVARGKGRGQD